MNVQFLSEPELEFGGGGRHIDVRSGIAQHGPFDRGSETAPTEIRVGIIGTSATVEGIRGWLERCRGIVPAKKTRQPNLFPAFPGFAPDGCFGSNLVFHDRWTAAISDREVEGLFIAGESLTSSAADMFLAYARQLLEHGGPTILLVAPPRDLLSAMDGEPGDRHDVLDEPDLDESSEAGIRSRVRGPAFHDLLKARGLALNVPLQMLRPQTYDAQQRTGIAKKGRRETPRLQDDATRAWNLHTAIYYKAGGIPWRLLRNPSALTSCFVGVSFYRSTSEERLVTSVAHVFNERGEGTIVKGTQAQVDKADLQAHLLRDDAAALLVAAVHAYRREHRTQPARVVLHKTSRFSAEELDGFLGAATTERIDVADLVSVRRSLTRVFRSASYPPLRGTLLELEQATGLLYLRGSVAFFRTYPGLYVPRPFEYRLDSANTTVRQTGEEVLALSKLNWNNTQFDGGEPITVRAARRVGDILKHVEQENVEASFRFFM